ncbi:MAG: hypothetical protein ACFFB3_13855 [Candidatus Hodarchaeota archaeon]
MKRDNIAIFLILLMIAANFMPLLLWSASKGSENIDIILLKSQRCGSAILMGKDYVFTISVTSNQSIVDLTVHRSNLSRISGPGSDAPIVHEESGDNFTYSLKWSYPDDWLHFFIANPGDDPTHVICDYAIKRPDLRTPFLVFVFFGFLVVSAISIGLFIFIRRRRTKEIIQEPITPSVRSCPGCGAPVEGRYCLNCGTPLE